MDQPLKWFEEHKLIAVIRSSSSEDAEDMIKAISAGGFRIFEISMQTPQALRLIETFAKKDNYLFGAGSVSDGEMAQRAINAGAKFISSYYTDREVINVAKHNDSFVIQGAATPTEAFDAHQFGADMVKIYPAGFNGGVQYLKALREPLPFVKFTAEGDINQDKVTEYLRYCVALSIGKSIFEKALVRSDNWAEITERAKQLTQKLDALRTVKA